MAFAIEKKAVQKILIGSLGLRGDLTLPSKEGHDFIIFAHGTGSSRLSPRNRFVAEELNKAGFGTLLLDLLTAREEEEESLTGHLRFDIELLAQRLIEATRASLDAAIAQCWPGRRLGDLGHAVQATVEPLGYSVVRQFVGHGIGRAMHEAPQVYNYGDAGKGQRLNTGLVIAIEPMVNAGSPDVRIEDDGWTAVTEDGSLSAHFEHSVAVTDDGPFVLSRA